MDIAMGAILFIVLVVYYALVVSDSRNITKKCNGCENECYNCPYDNEG